MCTLTLIPEEHGYTLTMNRDERRNRDEAGLYRASVGSIDASFPLDKVAGGTWIGLNNQGVSLALLNRYQAPSIETPYSRGLIIRQAIFKGTVNEICEYLKYLDVEPYNPFDLLLIDRNRIHQFCWDRTTYQFSSSEYTQPLIFTSSSERLAQVSGYRKAQFSKWVKRADSSKTISQFHLSQEQGRAADAVLMAREQVHSKSLVQIRVGLQAASLRYFDIRARADDFRLREILCDQSEFSLSNCGESLELQV